MVYEMTPWQDRFNEPTPKALRQGLPAPLMKVFDQARAKILKLDGITESMQWYGDCYRWSLEYRLDRNSSDPLAVLVPAPFDLQLAVPIEEGFLASLPPRGGRRAVSEGLVVAQEAFDTNWAIWSLTPDGILGDVLRIVERKLKHVAV